jgi:hypothetical protein
VNDDGDGYLDSSVGQGETAQGTVTIYSAIQQANLDGGGDEIDFASNANYIVPDVILPYITAPVIINGGAAGVVISGAASQLNLSGNDITVENLVQNNLAFPSNAPAIYITGNGCTLENDHIGTNPAGTTVNFGNAGSGVFITGSGNTVSGCVIAGNQEGGVTIYGTSATSNVIEGNEIGLNGSGTAILGNDYSGVIIYAGASKNTIGGAILGTGNIISGNGSSATPTFGGVTIYGTGTSGNVVEGNVIGTDVTGSIPLGNDYDGVDIYAGATGNTIGGTAQGCGNVISGNGTLAGATGGYGVAIYGSGTANNLVAGNFIGTDITGTVSIGNSNDGVDIFNGASNNTIGGITSAAQNLISGNITATTSPSNPPAYAGIEINGSGTNHNLVEANLIGVTVAGNAALPNRGDGILIDNGAQNNTIGGSVPGSASLVSGNAQNGIGIDGAGTSGNVVEGSSIGTDIGETIAVPNGTAGSSIGSGIVISGGATNNTIGGAGLAFANLISGNLSDGVEITGTGSSDNVVAGNHIGINRDGTAGLPNGTPSSASSTTGCGILIDSGAASNTIGGTMGASVTGNVVSGNAGNGIVLTGNGTTANLIEGNYIGTDPSGSVAIQNSTTGSTIGCGVVIGGGASNNTIGGSLGASISGNMISGNSSDGVLLTGDDTTANAVEGNYIGTTPTLVQTDAATGAIYGSAGIPNGGDGVHITDSSSDNMIGGTDGADDPVDAMDGNIIGFNTSNGVAVDSGTGNTIREDMFLDNGAGAFLPIALGGNATQLNPNSATAQGGANDLENYPVVTVSYNTPNEIQISNEGATDVTVEVYCLGQGTPSNGGPFMVGAQLLAVEAVGAGETVQVPLGQDDISANLQQLPYNIVGTATDPDGNTSEFGVALTPAQIRTAYGINDLPEDGAGQTIAIVSEGANPNLLTDLDAFDQQFGIEDSGPSLFADYGSASDFVTVVDQGGTQNAGAIAEEMLDIEWVHAIAPGAHIDVVEGSDFLTLVPIAAALPGVSVVSISYGDLEFDGELEDDSMFSTPGVVFLAGSGDLGSADPRYPAFSPDVVAVGGTTLTLNDDGAYGTEVGWGSGAPTATATPGGSGGGQSVFETEPEYQLGVQTTGFRTIPDVSIIGGTNVAITDSFVQQAGNPGWTAECGTSLATPIWAGLIALVDQGRAAAGRAAFNTNGPEQILDALYGLPLTDFHSPGVLGGDNGTTGAAGLSNPNRYNEVTGLGSPIVDLLVPDLINYNPVITVDTNALDLGTTTEGTAGDARTFTVGGSGLTADIILTAPTGVELSDDDGATYSATLDLPQTGGTVGTTTIDVRIGATAPAGSIGGNIAVDSAGATEQDIAVSGTVSTPTPTPTPTPTIRVGANALDLGTTTEGTAGGVQTFTVGGSGLTGDIILTAPPGVELSDDDGSGYSTTLDLPVAGGTVASVTIDARIGAGAPVGSITGDIAASSAGATTQEISVTGDVIGGLTVYTVSSTGSSPTDGSGTSGTLPYVIAQANANTSPAGSEITFDSSVFNTPQTIDLAGTLVLSESPGPEVINATGVGTVTVGGGDNFGVMKVDAGTTATVILLTIAGGSATQGGGIDNAGTLTLTGVTLSSNVATSGGGIYNAGTLTITGGTVSGNTGIDQGGGIDSHDGDVQIGGGCSIVGDEGRGNETTSGGYTAGSGGGIYDTGGKVTITGGTLARNTAIGDGGGIYIESGSLTLVGGTVSGNTARGDGAGVFDASGTGKISDGCHITGNSAGGQGDGVLASAGGGGVYVRSGSMKIRASTLSGNSTQCNGAGVLDDGGDVEISDGCSIAGNDADEDPSAGGTGGGVYQDGGAVSITGSTLKDNVAFDGGGVWGAEKCSLTVTASTLEGNTASDSGGGVAIVQGSATLTSCTISGNSAGLTGGAVCIDDAVAVLTNTIVAGNIAKDSGGGISESDGGKATIAGATIKDNSAPDGGGIYLHSGTLTIRASVLTGNTAHGDGAGVFVHSGDVKFSDSCSIASNSALGHVDSTVLTGAGGGIYDPSGAKVTIDGSKLTDNRAIWGGGVYVGSGSLTVSSSTLSGNSALNQGGGIDQVDGAVKITTSTLESNTANWGGGIYLSNNVSLSLGASTLSGNTAAAEGGGIDQDGGAVTVINSTFEANTADWGGGVYLYSGSLSLSASKLSGNTAASGGGGIGEDGGAITIISSTLQGNTADWGGGLDVDGGTFTMTASTLASNTAGSLGGGAFNDYELFAANCTVYGNVAAWGGGLYNEHTAALTACTISDNSTSNLGGGVYNTASGVTNLIDTIVAADMGSDGADDINGTGSGQVTGSHDLIGTGGSGGITDGAAGNIVLTNLDDLGLRPLANNGGPTETMALVAGSAAIGAGAVADYPGSMTTITTDQRGAPLGTPPDIGAYQDGSLPTPSPTPSPTPTSTSTPTPTSTSTPTPTAPALVSVLWARVETIRVGTGRKAKSEQVVLLQFSGALNARAADNTEAYELDPIIKVAASGKGKHKKPAMTKLGPPAPAASAVYSNDQVTLTPRAKFSSSKSEELIVNGSLVTDTLDRGIDGADDGVAGSNYIATIAGARVTTGGIALVRTEGQLSRTVGAIEYLLARGELAGLTDTRVRARFHDRS